MTVAADTFADFVDHLAEALDDASVDRADHADCETGPVSQSA